MELDSNRENHQDQASRLSLRARDKFTPNCRRRMDTGQTTTGSKRNDSYSVFGTFNGKSLADVKGRSPQLGKTFATGVAAQRCAEGLKVAATTITGKEWVVALTKLVKIGSVPGDAILKNGRKICSAAVEDDVR